MFRINCSSPNLHSCKATAADCDLLRLEVASVPELQNCECSIGPRRLANVVQCCPPASGGGILQGDMLMTVTIAEPSTPQPPGQ
ncbi:hypothetical protein PoB_003422300 [Plakobranchus ocellatus]|uniref:PDZ domain-containing protein n=1 Tax=Plakobranchus ocellatus TaxID=259542 RepID=A0AAV4AK85_9GAST|nr:hypothetical protein PoB_003422300 [Plakobranchus ocellatus]